MNVLNSNNVKVPLIIMKPTTDIWVKLKGLAKKNNESIAVTKNLGKNLQDKLDQTDFELKNTV